MSDEVSYRRGDVVLVSIDFTDRSGSKVRSVVVVSSDVYNRTSPDLLIASITSNLNALPHPGDHRILKWSEAGLLKPSIAQAKLATIEAPIIRRKLGELGAEDFAVFSMGLGQA